MQTSSMKFGDFRSKYIFKEFSVFRKLNSIKVIKNSAIYLASVGEEAIIAQYAVY